MQENQDFLQARVARLTGATAGRARVHMEHEGVGLRINGKCNKGYFMLTATIQKRIEHETG